MESRLQRLKIEGTPRVKRERRAAAPPLSPTAETTDFSDFMLPSLDGASDDFGGAALRIYESIFSPSPEGTPSSPTPASGTGGAAMLGTSPVELDDPDMTVTDLRSGETSED
jgi:cytokinesis protein